jgi:BlaI family penicillinase repressor
MEVPRISDAEWQVMRVIWENGEISAGGIIEKLKDKVNWKANTIKSLVNRLLNKKVIGYTRAGKEYIYHPLIPQQDCIKAEAESFLDRIFDGSLNSLVMHFADAKKLSPKDIDELESILEKMDK